MNINGAARRVVVHVPKMKSKSLYTAPTPLRLFCRRRMRAKKHFDGKKKCCFVFGFSP